MMNTSHGAAAVLADGGDGGPSAAFVPSTGLILGALLALLIVVVVLGGLAWWGWRRVRRSGLVERGMLAARTVTAPAGPQREIAELRRDLNAHLAQTRRVFTRATTGLPALAAPAVLEDLLPRLERTAAALDAQLHILQTEPDPVVLDTMLPALRERVRTITDDSVSLRQTALRLLGEGDQPQRSLLEQDLRDSVAGLDAGLDEIRALQVPGHGALPPAQREGELPPGWSEQEHPPA